MVSANKNLQDTRHDTLVGRTKRTPTNTRTRSSVSKRMGVSSGQRWANRNRNKLWLAEAILKENDTQYLIEYAPVYEGAQREISWQPKHYANAALVRDWKERNMANVHESSNAERENDSKSTSRDNEAGQRSALVEHGDQESAANFPSQEPHDADLESREQHTTEVVDKTTSASFGNCPEDTLLTAASTIITEDSSVHTPKSNMAVTEMCDDHKGRELHDFSAVASYSSENGSAPPQCGLQIHNYRPSAGDTINDNPGKPSPRPGTSISTILLSEPCTLSEDNESNQASTFAKKHSSQALPRMSAETEVSKKSAVSGGPPGKLASAREQLRLLLQGPGRRRYRKSHPRSPPSS
jgi:hypothetical protein